ncbi:hypothetical protein [Marinomonas sp.]|uniref:hypothetical protein n=1 Tax=Marinomonas sp. TaxID=1904862 RepID=UPI003BA888C8
MKSSTLILAAIFLLVVCFSVPSFFRWRKHRRELREKLFSRLSNRSDRLFYSLEMVSDRYLTRDTKIFVIEHLLSVIEQLVRANYRSEFVSKQTDLTRLLNELKSGQRVVSKDRVATQEHLDHTHNAILYILKEMKNMPERNGASRAIIRHHVLLIRYAHALAYRDLLVRQARDDLDNEKKNRALEKYRMALSVIEKNSSVSSSRREVLRLQNMIQDVENVLFGKKDETGLKLK